MDTHKRSREIRHNYRPYTRKRRKVRSIPYIRRPRGPICNPAQYKDKTRIPNSCQTRQSLKKLVETTRLNIKTDMNSVFESPEDLWKQLIKNNPKCKKDEACIVKSILKTDKLPTDIYGHEKPEQWNNPMGHVDTFWTDKQAALVMSSYEKAYPHFYFAPPSFINYDTIISDSQCVTPELCQMSLADLKQKQKTDIGILFNTDRYGGEGIHWICVYIQLQQKNIVFFDSLGDEPPSEIIKFVDMLKSQDPTLKFIKITEPHQQLDGECGTYCIFAMLLLLTGTRHLSLDETPMSWKDRIRFLKKTRLTDKYIRVYRDYFMRSRK